MPTSALVRDRFRNTQDLTTIAHSFGVFSHGRRLDPRRAQVPSERPGCRRRREAASRFPLGEQGPARRHAARSIPAQLVSGPVAHPPRRARPAFRSAPGDSPRTATSTCENAFLHEILDIVEMCVGNARAARQQRHSPSHGLAAHPARQNRDWPATGLGAGGGLFGTTLHRIGHSLWRQNRKQAIASDRRSPKRPGSASPERFRQRRQIETDRRRRECPRDCRGSSGRQSSFAFKAPRWLRGAS